MKPVRNQDLNEIYLISISLHSRNQELGAWSDRELKTRTESQSRTRWNAVNFAVSVAEFRWDDEETLATRRHANNTLIPALDYFSGTKLE